MNSRDPRRPTRAGLRWTLERLLVGGLSLTGREPRLSVLLFHRVLEEPDPFRWGDPSIDEFTGTMSALAEHFTVVSLREGLERLDSGSLPRRAAAITFDDGYRDNLTAAAPVLERLGLAATVFVATGHCGGTWMWNDRVIETVSRTARSCVAARPPLYPASSLADEDGRVRAAHAIIDGIRRLPRDERTAIVSALEHELEVTLPPAPMLDRDDIRALRARGWDVGAHTVSHPILSTLSDSEARGEILQSREFLAETLREPVDLFAYPNGKPGADYLPVHVEMVRDAGFSSAASTIQSAAARGGDRYQVPRFTPWDREPLRFCVRLATSRAAAPAAAR